MAKRAWRQADAVCFDVDSTLIIEEGIDGLAEFCGAGSSSQGMVRLEAVQLQGGGISMHLPSPYARV